MSTATSFAWVLFAGGMVLFAVGVVYFLMTRAYVAKATRAEATVVVIEEVLKHSDGTPSAHKAKFWVAEFKDQHGRRRQLRLGETMDVKLELGPLQLGEDGTDKSLPAAGSRIAVLFDPRDPTRVRRDSFQALWMVAVASLAGGILCLGVSALLLVL